MHNMKQLLITIVLLPLGLTAQIDKFAQLGEEIPTPNEYRNAAGA